MDIFRQEQKSPSTPLHSLVAYTGFTATYLYALVYWTQYSYAHFPPKSHRVISGYAPKKISISREMFIAKNAYCGNLSALFTVAIYLFLNR